MDWEINWADMCRSCMEAQDDLKPLYSESDGDIGETDIAYKIMQISSIKIKKDDGLPSKICDKCAYRVSSFYDFKCLIEESEMKLQQILYEHLNPNDNNDNNDALDIEQGNCFSIGEKENDSFYNSDNIRIILETVDENGVVRESELEDFDNICDTVTLNIMNDDVQKSLDNNVSLKNLKLVFNSKSDDINESLVANNQIKNKTQDINVSSLEAVDDVNTNINTTIAQPNKSNDKKLDNNEIQNYDDDESDSDNYLDSRENIVGSINDTITRIKEIKKDGQIVHYQCTLCLQNYPELSEVLNHIVDLHVPIAGPFYCIICEMDCDSIKHLKAHVKIHKGPTPYICFICKKAYVLKRYLKRHMACHTDFPRHRCTKCGKKYKAKNELEDHITIYHAEEATSFKCSQCSRVFNHKGNYKRHLINHLDPKGIQLPKFPCDVCNRRFLNNRALITHMRVHTGDKPFICEICGRAFSQQGNLMTHKKIHSNPRNFKCEVCGKCFNQKGTLKDHSLLHSGEKPYICSVCGIAFTFSAALRRHMWSHSDGKPFECDICKAKFVGRYDLRRHITVHTGRPKRKNKTNKAKKSRDVVTSEETVSIAEAPSNSNTIFVEQILLNDAIEIIAQEEAEKENVDSLLGLIQIESN